MKIHQTPGSIPPPRPASTQRNAAAQPATEAVAKAAASSNVHRLSPNADESFNAERVAAIREDIRAGRYQVNAERIADGLLESVGHLLGSAR